MLPIINLDDENYNDITQKAINMIASVYPEWTDYNEHDPGITFINLFAWLKEMQQYHLNQIGQQHYLKYIKLLGTCQYKMRPSEAYVCMKDVNEEFILPKGAKLLAGDIPFETVNAEVIVKEKISKLYSISNDKQTELNYFPDSEQSKIRFYIFGKEPEAGNEFCICFSEPLSVNTLHNIYFDVFHDYPIKRNYIDENFINPLASLQFEFYSKRGWSSLEGIIDETHAFIQSGRIFFKIVEEMQQKDNMYWIRVKLNECDYDVPPLIKGISMNMIPVKQTNTCIEYQDFNLSSIEDSTSINVIMNTELAKIGDHELYIEVENGFKLLNKDIYEIEELPDGACFKFHFKEINQKKRNIRIINSDSSFYRRLGIGDGFPNQEFELNETHILYDTFEIMVEDEINPGCFHIWTKVEDFDHSNPEDYHYILEEDSGILYFGDCEHGRAPEGRIEIISCKTSIGSEGNVKAEKINQFLAGYVKAEVMNYNNAENGRNKETIQACINRIQHELKKIERAVTYKDYENLVLQASGLMVKNVKALPISKLKQRYDSIDENCVTVVVQPFSFNQRKKLSKSYHNNIYHLLNQKRMLGTKVKIISPEYIGVTIYAEIEIEPHYREANQIIREKVEAYFGAETWEFGTPVLYSNIYGIIDTLKCVIRIQSLSIDAQGRGISRNKNGDIILPENGLIYLKEASYSIQVSN